MTKEEAYNILLKLRAWRTWGHSKQNGTDRPELPSQKEIDQALDVFIEVLSQPSFLEDLEEAAMAQYPKVWREYPKDGIIRSEEYYDANEDRRGAFIVGTKWQKDKILKLIEARISEIIGDAQPNPVLRLELQGIIDKIK